MEAVCVALSNDEAAVRIELEQTRHDRDAAVGSERAMQDLVDDLWNLRVVNWARASFGFDDAAPLGDKADFVAAFREHIPIMAGCLYVPSFEVLNASVDRLLSRITWEEVYDIVDAAITHLFQVIRRTSNIANNLSNGVRHCQGRLVEARRLNRRFRSTCQELQHLVVAPAPAAL